jgi:hypothetical protein
MSFTCLFPQYTDFYFVKDHIKDFFARNLNTDFNYRNK